MTTSEFLTKLAAETGMTKKKASETLDTFVGLVKDMLKAEDSLSLREFGKFAVVTRKARVCHNPKTGEKLNVPEKKVPVFKFSAKALK